MTLLEQMTHLILNKNNMKNYKVNIEFWLDAVDASEAEAKAEYIVELVEKEEREQQQEIKGRVVWTHEIKSKKN